MVVDAEFERLVCDAEGEPFSGWDFSYIRDRVHWGSAFWSYDDRVRSLLASTAAVLDMGTGGGELLASLAPLPRRTVATEGYPPNVEVARNRLAPLGVEVVAVDGAPDNVEIGPGDGIGSLPFRDGSFPLVINRHESYYPAEVFRILEPGGLLITQQVGAGHNQELNRLLGAPMTSGNTWDLAFATRQLEDAGFQVVDGREAFPETVFHDVGAVVYYLKAVPWQVSGFSVQRYRGRLEAIHRLIKAEGTLRVPGHLFFVEARKSVA